MYVAKSYYPALSNPIVSVRRRVNVYIVLLTRAASRGVNGLYISLPRKYIQNTRERLIINIGNSVKIQYIDETYYASYKVGYQLCTQSNSQLTYFINIFKYGIFIEQSPFCTLKYHNKIGPPATPFFSPQQCMLQSHITLPYLTL